MKFPPLLRILSIAIGLVLLMIIPATLFLQRSVYFKSMMKQKLEAALSGENIQTRIGDVGFHPFHGFTAENVVLNSTQEDKPQIGNIQRLTFSLNILGFLPGRPLVKKVHLHNASVNIPLSEDTNQFLPIRNANITVLLGTKRFEVANAKFTFENIQFSARGLLLNPQMLKSPPHYSQQRKNYLQKLNYWTEELRKIKYLNGPPRIDILFEGDLSTPEKLRVLNVTLHAENFQYHDITFQQVELSASYVQGALEVQELYIQLPKGNLTAQGTGDLNTSQGHLNLDSSIDPIPLLTKFFSNPKIQKLKNLHVASSPPQINLNTDVSWEGGQLKYNGTGYAKLQSFSYRDSSFPLLELKFHLKDKTLEVEQFQLQDSKGKLEASGNIDLSTAQGHYTLNSTLDLLPLLKEFLPTAQATYLKGLHTEVPPKIGLDMDVLWKDNKPQYKGTGSLSLSSFSYNKQFFPQLDLKFSAAEGGLQINQLRLRDSKGELTGSGAATSLDPLSGRLSLHSCINPFPVLNKFIVKRNSDILQNLQMKSFPKIDFDTEFFWKDNKLQYKGAGTAMLHSFYYKKQFFPQLDLKFTTENGRFAIQNLRLQTHSGTLQANGVLTPNKFQIYANSTVSPKEFMEFFDRKTREFFNQMEIVDSPHITANLSGSPNDLNSLSGNGELTLGRTAVRKAWIDFARTKFEINRRAIICRNFSIGHNEGRASGTLTYDFKEQLVRLNNVDSTLVPTEVMQWIDPNLTKVISVYKFYTPPRVQGNGVVHLKNQNLNALTLHINSDTGLAYDLLKRTLHLGSTVADVHIEGPWVKVNVPTSSIFQGTISLTANVSIDPKNPIFWVNLNFSHVDFASLTKLYFNYDSSKGFLSGNFGFKAQMGHEEDMVGKGIADIEDGTVLSIPFLGPLSAILNKIVPGSGNAPAKQATASFQVQDRKITTNTLKISGIGFSLFGYGDIEFLTGKMDMTMRINARGLPGLLFLPISKLLEYESRGTISNPEWRLKSPFSHNRDTSTNTDPITNTVPAPNGSF